MADVLRALDEGSLTLEAVEKLYDSIMESEMAQRAAEKLGLSTVEWTAFGHGVWFDELATWRKDGWPLTCLKCGETVVIERFGWRAVERDDGTHSLEHVECSRN